MSRPPASPAGSAPRSARQGLDPLTTAAVSYNNVNPLGLAVAVMRAVIRKLGNSSGVIIPKSMLAELGITTGDAVDLSLEDGRIAITPVRRRPREGWAEASRAIAEAGEDALVWPEFGNEADDELTW